VNRADAVTLFRTALVFVIVYMVLAKVTPWVIIPAMAVMFGLDWVDGHIAKHEIKRGRKPSWYGPRLDVAGDRITEYALWILFTFLGIVPLIILLLVVARHSFADALMGAKGTSSKMKTKFAKVMYASDLHRGGVGIAKFITFSYLALGYVTNSLHGAFLDAAYILIGILFVYIMLRGIAEVYEATSPD
jgi:phosphatidylglycerophosphate synthase